LAVSDPKEGARGMDIPDLRDLNLHLLASWVQRYNDGEGKI
jgi:hypothetical protein